MAGSGKFAQVQAPTKVVHSNLDQEIIQITEDRLRLVLKDHLELLEEKKAWHAPLGVLIAIVAAFVTADFRDAYFKAATWQAVFLITGILSSIWLFNAIYRAATSPSIDDVVSKIKTRSTDGET
jgi:hypothetical protein